MKKILSVILLIAAFFLSLALGAEKLSLAALIGQGDKFENIILWKLRLPRSTLVLLTGILLGGSGAVFQLFFRNPLAEPGIMGISSGATLGAVIATIILSALPELPPFLTQTVFKFISPINFCAFAGALAAGLFVTALAFSRAGKSSYLVFKI